MKSNPVFSGLVLVAFLLLSCDSESQSVQDSVQGANVTSVSASGEENHYQFSVTLRSPDTGCDQYADWWEVISESGELLYRRILTHSHVNEQPFTRSGGEVKILRNQKVWIRGHMNNTGYGGDTMFGSVQEGFASMQMEEDFALELESENPLPSGCAF